MLQLKNLSKDFAGKPLFINISWHLRKGERVGLVGENGAGKSTFMRIIAGQIEPSAGDIQLARSATVGYLPQDGIITRGRTLFAEALSALVLLGEMEQEIRDITTRLERISHDDPGYPALLERFGHLQEEFRLKGGYAMEAEVGDVLRGLGFLPSDWERDCGEFSGGWQMRIALAKLLLQKPNVLLLDEPTNHLDIEARNWLEEYLCSHPWSVMLVSHDRFFLDKVCSRMAEIWNHTVTDYHCNYSRYLTERDERVSALREAKRRQDEEVQKMEEFISRFRYKADKAALVQSRMKQLEKIDRIVLPPERKKIRFRFPDPPKSGRIAMELKEISKSYGAHVVLDSVSLTVEKGERIALVGHNGAGKSTLMRIMAGGDFQSGERSPGHNTVIDYFAQDQAMEMTNSRTVYEEMYADAPYDMVPQLRDMLGAFLFSGDDIQKRVEVLSGGERNRLALAKMLLRPANLLLMDEPTNHLDLFSKEVLLDALRSFAGTVIFVSHDRHFIDGLATRVVEVEGGQVTSYYGDYEYFLAKKASSDGSSPRTSSIEPQTSDKTRTSNPDPRSSNLSRPSIPDPRISVSREERLRLREEEKDRQREERRRQKQLAETEAEIEKQEAMLAQLDEEMAKPEFFKDHETARRGSEQHSLISGRIADLYAQWETLQ